MKRTTSGILALPLAALVLASGAACWKAEQPVYVKTDETVFQGSIYYNQANCQRCHGAEFDGQGPEASAFRNAGTPVPAFKDAEIEVGVSPVDYFKAVTVGYDNVPGHSFQSYTDRGRWAMAHFLYSLTKKPKDSGHAAKVAAEMAEAAAAYKTQRRWVMGYKPIEERPGPPDLAQLRQSAGLTETAATPSAGAVGPERLERRDADSEGGRLYEQSCAGCHGLYGEGRPEAIRVGVVNCDREDYPRRCAVFYGTGDLAGSGALGGVGAFREAHLGLQQDYLNMPAFTHYTDEEWDALYQYTRSLTGR